MIQLAHNLTGDIPHSAFRTPHWRRRPRRSGISIIEVMTAIVVALIGVFGTLVLIPFAIKQAQSGLDLDDGRNLAENSQAMFEIMGFDDPTQWVTGFAKTNMADTQSRIQPLTRPPALAIMIDPLWINSNSQGGLDGNVGRLVEDEVRNNFGFFGDGVLQTDPDAMNASDRLVASVGGPNPVPPPYPFFGQVHPALPADLRIRRFTLTSGAGSNALMTGSLTQRLFQSTDALNFSEFDSDEIGPDGEPLGGRPFQIFDRDAAGNILNRQTTGGRLSQAMFIIPGDGQVQGVYRRVTLVFAGRDLTLYENPGGTRPATDAEVNSPTGNVNLRGVMASAIVTTRGNIANDLPSGFEGGEIVLCHVDWSGGGNPIPNQRFVDLVGTPEAPGFRRDDWVMMINQLPSRYPLKADGSAGELPDRQQIQFYRVANIDEGQGDPREVVPGSDLSSLTLDGPAFDLGPDGMEMDPDTGNPFRRSVTYVIHLRDVVNVYEDAISL